MELIEEEKIYERISGAQVSISGLLANVGDMLMTQLQCPMGCCGRRVILCNPNRFIFGDTIFLAFTA